MRFPEVALRLPAWVEEVLADRGRVYPTVEDRMRLAVELSRLNVRHGTGGPFGAAIFERGTGELLAPASTWLFDPAALSPTPRWSR